MKTKNQILLYFALGCALPAAIAQQPIRSSDLKKISEEGIHRNDLTAFAQAVRTDDPYAAGLILQAGRSGDSFWVPYLEPILKKRHRVGLDNNEPGAAQMALARLGQKDQLQEIACEVNFGSASIQYDAVGEKLKYVQGWFSIQILKGWIDERPKPTPLLLDHPGDEIFVGPRIGALLVLPKIVSNPPFPAPIPFEPWLLPKNQEKLTQLRQGWVDWLDKNEDSLRKLAPSGEGLDLLPASCKRVLAHDHHFDRSTLK